MFSKLVGKVSFSEIEFQEMQGQKGTRDIQGIACFSIIVFSCLSSAKWCFRFFKFVLLRSSLGNEVDFRDLMNVSPNILAKN